MTATQPASRNETNWLILIPTGFELKFVKAQISLLAKPIEICGFGPIVAAARTAQLIQEHQPARVLLMGIAGTYTDQIAVGDSCSFRHVACYGVGLGAGHDFQTAQQMGWQYWVGDSVTSSIGDQIKLSYPKRLAPDTSRPADLLITATTAAATSADVENRLRAYPGAVAEDMEAFGVAAACQLSGVPLFVVRGISNRAGDRDKSNWQIQKAMTSAAHLSQLIIESEQ